MEKCIRCREVHPDHRTIRISCLYQLDELPIPFRLEEDENANGRYTYCITVCKACRATFMDMLVNWWQVVEKRHDGVVRDIPVRIHGHTVMLSEKEYRHEFPDKFPNVIYCKLNDLFWSSQDGWVPYGDCDRYTDEEVLKLALPSDGAWVKMGGTDEFIGE